MAAQGTGSIFHRGLSKLCLHQKYAEKSNLRTVYNNVALEADSDRDVPPQLSYKTNRIKTTKYTILTFIPKNLFEQFHRFANIYFLFIALINWIPAVNAFGKELGLIPVLGVLTVTAIKDGYEDYRRYKQDKKVNFTKCLVYERGSGTYKSTDFYRVLVGDIVKVKCNEVIPADLLLLGCSDEASSNCFIETANLDGESNLKQRSTVSLDDSGLFDPRTYVRIECELPNAELNKFNGYVQNEAGRKKALSKDNLLLRGCVLRNTDYIEGIVIYAGHDTKAMKNSSGPRYKRSSLERLMNRDVLWCLVILIFLCLFSAIGAAVWLSQKWDSPEDISYIPQNPEEAEGPVAEGFIRFWTFLILYQVMIPLSLYATLEIVKSCQVYFIHHDREMYYEESDIQPVCRALNITEDLGQVQHIFSDKTGTLTENKMIFKACSVGHMLFRETEPSPSSEEDETGLSADPMFATALSTSVLTSVANGYSDTDLTEEDKSKIDEFLVLLATCNTVVVSSHSHNSNAMYPNSNNHSIDSINSLGTTVSPSPNGVVNKNYSRFGFSQNGSASANTLDVPMTTFTPVKNAFRKITDKIRRSFASDEMSNVSLGSVTAGGPSMLSQKTLTDRYEAESPDELALVKAVCKYGCRLLSRTSEAVSVYLPSADTLSYKVLAILPFDSVRKCMSVVMRNELSNQIILYTKGADNIIFDKIKLVDEEQRDLLKRTKIYVDHFAKDGLRTLCMGKRVLEEAEFEEWYSKYTNCDIGNSEDEQFQLCNEIEANLELLGATGIEDRLQDGVAESVKALEKAGIKVWVLTGDKQETAINIGYSCGLLPQDAAVLTLNVPNADEVESVIQGHLLGSMRRPRALSNLSTSDDAVLTQPPHPEIPRCLVVDGKTLGFIFSGNLSGSFLKLADNCLSVLCCRTTPSQKAQIVALVKSKSNKLTLSIGDGANDVNMIRTANVGVGIEGLEGKQASMAADFSVGRFKHLVRLLFVHGHWSYDRLAVMTLYNFFKNSNLIFVLFWYQIFCMFSGQNHIDQIYLIVFQLLFTSLPPIVVGVLDQDLPADVLMAHPRLYKQGPENKLYHKYSYWLQIMDSLYQSLVIFFIPYLFYVDSDVAMWSFGTVQTIALVITQLWTLSLETRTWNWLFIVSNILSILVFILFVVILNATCVTCNPPSNPFGVLQQTLEDYAGGWFCILISAIVAILPRVVCIVLSNTLYPTDVIYTRSLILDPPKRRQTPSKVHILFPEVTHTSSSVTEPI